jgi:hypothetical protein
MEALRSRTNVHLSKGTAYRFGSFYLDNPEELHGILATIYRYTHTQAFELVVSKPITGSDPNASMTNGTSGYGAIHCRRDVARFAELIPAATNNLPEYSSLLIGDVQSLQRIGRFIGSVSAISCGANCFALVSDVCRNTCRVVLSETLHGRITNTLTD